MARPSKPVAVLESEKKSHRTKAELEQREKGEAALLSGKRCFERESVRGKVDALNARLKYEQLDIFSRRELEQELADIYEEWDETKYQRGTTDAKSLLEAVYTQTQDIMNAAPAVNIDGLNAAISAAFEGVGESYAKSIEQGTQSTQAVYNIVVNAQDKTTDQIVREVQRAISSGMI